MCEYANLQCERSNKKNMVVVAVVVAAAGAAEEEGGDLRSEKPGHSLYKVQILFTASGIY